MGANFFDSKRLADWDSWEHRFDELIVDETSALTYADQMLASLGDTYTERLIPAAATNIDAATASAEPPADPPENIISVVLPGNLGYFRILNFDDEDITDRVEAALDKIKDCDGLLLDLCHNSGGRLHRAIECCGLFLSDGLITTVETRHEGGGITQRKYYLNADQFFCIQALPDGTQTTELYNRRPAIMAGKPVVILLNRRTASAAEMFAAAIVQNGVSGKVMTIGGTTAAKGIGQAIFEIPDSNVRVQITRSRWLAPGGEWLGDCGQTEHNGIEPEMLLTKEQWPDALKIAVKELRKMLAGDDDGV